MKKNSHTDLRTSHPQFLGKGSQYREEDSENEILSEEYMKKVKIIEIIFQFFLPAGCECTETPIALLAPV